MNKDTLINTENEIRELFKQKRIRSMFHLSGGNEDVLLAIFSRIKPNDWVFSTHRSHYHFMLKGARPEKLKKDVVDGKSMHLFDRDLKFFTSSIVGGILPIALGVAMAIKFSKSIDKVWVFVGDMCSNMGVFHECVKYAEGHDLPIIFIIEDNGLCILTNTKESWGTCKHKGRVIKYNYKSSWPHSGTGDWVTFDGL